MKLRERMARLLIGPPAPGQTAAPAAPAPSSSSESRDNAVADLLQTCAKAFVPRGLHVRANVMTFSADGKRRRVNASTAFNMATDSDRDLEIDWDAAASGKAASERRAAMGDLVLLQITAVPNWGLRAEEQAQVRPSLKSILSVPVFNPANVDGPLLGTLQVDSDLTVEEAGFNRPEAAELLQQFADVLSLVMTGVDVRLASSRKEFAGRAPKSRVQQSTQVEPGIYLANTSTSIFQLFNGR